MCGFIVLPVNAPKKIVVHVSKDNYVSDKMITLKVCAFVLVNFSPIMHITALSGCDSTPCHA